MADEELRFRREILGVALLLIGGSMFIILPFLDALVLAVATSYLLRFAHRRLNRIIESEILSSAIIITSVLGAISLGVFFFINNFYDILHALNVFTLDLQANLNAILNSLNLPENFRSEIINFINNLSGAAETRLRSTLASIPTLFIHLGIYTVTAIYLYKDGSRLEKKAFSIIENLPKDEQKIVRTLIRSTDSIFKGVFLTQVTVAIILAFLSAAGFYAIAYFTGGIPFIPLWSFLIGVAALMPLFAAFMIYGPIGGYYLLFGEPLKGSLILVFGTLFLNILPEILIRPYVGSRQMNEHPLIIFIGFIAGPLALGLKGIVIGPVLLILSKEFVLNYGELVSGEPE